ncbi:MAG TPA: ribonuclease P protein component [Candidatus Binatia bacterium]|nr:ribonuclease P protein component [Candidatus Binatia bacterium]
MLGKPNRFHGYGSLKYVYRNGRTVRGPLFSVKSVANPRRDDYRFAVVISRKVNKSAVARNRMRRRLYEAFKEAGGDSSTPADIVLTVFHDGVLEEPFDKLVKQLKKQLRSSGLLK